MTTLLCRFFVVASDENEARSRAEPLKTRLAASSKDAAWKGGEFKPYWKIAGWYETQYASRLPSAAAALALEKAIARALGDGWEWLPTGRTGVCASSKHGRISIPHVPWIELDVIDA